MSMEFLERRITGDRRRADFRTTGLSWLLLLLLPVLLHLPALTGRISPDPLFFNAAAGDVGHPHAGRPWIDPNTGFQAQALGKLSADLWLEGRIPWWNPYNGIGLPLAAEAQPASFFLPFVLLLHFRSGGIWLELLLQMVAGACMLGFLRRLHLTTLAAFAGAALFELNGTFAWHGAPIASPVAFLPMLLLGVEMLRARVVEERAGGWWLIPPALAWSIYAGFPEIAYIDGLFVGLWSLGRLSGLENKQRARFFATLAVAGLIGLLLSMPLIVPFAEYVGRAVIGPHGAALAHARPPYASLPLYLMPWLYGPIFSFDDPANVVYATWGSIGGYFTAAQLLLALLSIPLCKRGIRFVLLAWIVVCLAKSFDLRPFSDLFNLVPMIESAAFYRYASASWELAGAALIAFTIDGMQRKIPIAAGKVFIITVLVSLLIASTLWLPQDTLLALLKLDGYPRYFYIAIGWLVASLGAAVVLVLLGHRRHHAIRVLVCLMILDACLAYALPVRSGVKHMQTHRNAVAFLQSHLGLQRIYSLGPLAPNYGGYFKIAQINHNYLPASQDWVDYIHDHLDPHADPIIFNGSFGHAEASKELVARLGAYESLGVKYVLTPPGTNPFAEASPPSSDTQQPGETTLTLHRGSSIAVSWMLPAIDAGRSVQAVTAVIGNDDGRSYGVLAAKVCTDRGVCSTGSTDLKGALEHAPISISLDKALDLSTEHNAQRISVTLEYQNGTAAMQLWQMMTNPSRSVQVDGKEVPAAPSLALIYQAKAETGATLAYSGADMSIYLLPHPAAYFEDPSGICDLHVVRRDSLSVNCPAPSQLIRREAFYPGWHALIDGHESPIYRGNEIFQHLALPKGRHTVVFEYYPSRSWLILSAFLLGCCLFIAGFWYDEVRRRGV
jgi:hypothetical protein